MQDIYRAPSPATRKRKAQELLTKHALAWEANMERASILRKDAQSILNISTLHREKVRLDAINEAKRRQKANLSWESSLRTLQTTQVVPVGGRYSGLQCTISNDPNAINLQNIINMPIYRDPIHHLPDDLRKELEDYRSRVAQRAISRAMQPSCDLPDAEFTLLTQNKHSLASSTHLQDSQNTAHSVVISSNRSTNPDTTVAPVAISDSISPNTAPVDCQINSARTNTTGVLSTLNSRGQRLPAGTAAQKADKLAQYITEKNSHIVTTYMPELNLNTDKINTTCIMEPIAFALQELRPRIEITNLTTVIYNSREKVGYNVATVTVHNVGDSVVSLRLVPKGAIDLANLDPIQFNSKMSMFEGRDIFTDRARSPESTRSLMSVNSNAPVHKLRQNLGAVPSSSVNRLLDLVSQDPKRYRSNVSTTSHMSLGATVNIVGSSELSRNQSKRGSIEAVEAKKHALSETLTANIASSQTGIDTKRLIQKSTTPVELRVLATQFLKENKSTETNLIVSVPSSTWNLNPGCSTSIGFILPLSETGAATPGIILREYWIVTCPAVEVSLLSLEDTLHANRLIETAADGTSTRINIRCYGISSDFLQTSNSIRSLSKRGIKMMSDLYLRQMCAELVSELIFLAMEVSRVTELDNRERVKERGIAKYNINTKAMHIHETGTLNVSWVGAANDIKQLLSDLVIECEGLDLSVQSLLAGYTDDYFPDELDIYGSTQTTIRQRRIFGLYHLAADPEASRIYPFLPHALVSTFGYLNKIQLGSSGCTQHTENKVNATLRAAALPPMQIPTTARFALMKVDSRFKAAHEGLACNIKRFTHEILPTKQLLFYKNSPHYLKLAAYNSVALKAFLMPYVPLRQTDSSPTLSLHGSIRPPLGNEQVSTDSPAPFTKNPLGPSSQAGQLDRYRQSSLALIQEHIVVDAFSDKEADLVVLSSLESIEYDIFCRGIARNKELLALTAPIVPTSLARFLYEKIGFYCQMLLEQQIVKVMNRGKGATKHRLSLMSNGLISASARPSWAENLSTLISMASATSSIRPLSTVFGSHLSSSDTGRRNALTYLVKLRHLLELKAAERVGSFVPCFWDSVCKEFAHRKRNLQTYIYNVEDDALFSPKTDSFMISVFYYRLKLTCQTVVEEEQARLEAEKIKKPSISQKPIVPTEAAKDTKGNQEGLHSFKHLFLKHVYYADPVTKEPYDGTSLACVLSAMEQTEQATDETSPSIPLLVEEQGIPQDKVDNAIETIIHDVAELMLREMLYLLTMSGRMYIPFIYALHDINLIDPHAVTRGAAFPSEQIDWNYYPEHQYTPFCPENMSQDHRNMLYAHYEVVLFSDQVAPPHPYANAILHRKGRASSNKRIGDQSPASTPQRSSSNASLADQTVPNLYLMSHEGPYTILDYLVLDKIVPPTGPDIQLAPSKRPPISSEKLRTVPSTESHSVKIRCFTGVPTSAMESDRLACLTGLSSILKTSYEKLKTPLVQEPVKKGVKGKEEPPLSMTTIPLPKTFLGIFFADADPNTIASRLFSRSFFEANACFLTGLASVTTPAMLTEAQTTALSDALECLAITTFQPFRPMQLNYALLDAVFAAIQLSSFPKTETIDNMVHYISVVAFKHAKTVFSKQCAVVNHARKQLHKYVVDICSCLFAKNIGLSLPLQHPPVPGGVGSSSSSKSKGSDATTLSLIQLVDSFKTSMSMYLAQNFSSEVVFLDPNLLLHLGRLIMESSCPTLPDVPRLTNIFSEMTNYMNLSLYAYGVEECTPFTTERLIRKVDKADEDLEGKLMATNSPGHHLSHSSFSNSTLKPGIAKRSRNRGNLTLSVSIMEDGPRPYLGLTERTEELYLESLTPQQIKEYQLAKAFYKGLGEDVTSVDRFTKRKVDYAPEFNEPLDIGSLVYELKLASFQREFDTFIDALFTHYTDDLITEHCDRLRLYDDELDEYELTYQKLVGIANGELTAEEAGIDLDAAIHPTELPIPIRPDVTLYPTFQKSELKNDADCFTIRKYIGFTYSSSYQKTSLEYFVDGLILTMLELVQVAKRVYRSQAPLEYDTQEYDKKFDDAVWGIINACGYTESDVKAIEMRYGLPDRLESPSNNQDMHRIASHTYLSDEGEDELSGPMSAFLKKPPSECAETPNDNDTLVHHEDTPFNKEMVVFEVAATGNKEDDDNGDSVEDGECRNDAQFYQEPPHLSKSFQIPVEALEKLCALFCIKPSSLTDAESMKAQALTAIQAKDISGCSTIDISLTSFIENIGVRTLSSFESLYSYLSTHIDIAGASSGASKAMRLPVYLSLLTPSGPFGTIFADAIVQPSTTKCAYIVDVTEENALLLAGNLGILPPKPEKDTKSRASPTKSNAPQRDQKLPTKSEIVPQEGKNLLDAAIEGLAGSSKFQEGVKEGEEEAASDIDDSMASQLEEEYIAPMNKPVEIDTVARRDVWGVLFDRFVNRAFAWVDACDKIPELVIKVVNYSVRDFADFVD